MDERKVFHLPLIVFILEVYDYLHPVFLPVPDVVHEERVIPLLKEVEETLLEEKENQKRTGVNNVDEVDSMTGFMFANRFGKLLLPSSVNCAIVRISDAYNAEEAVREKREPILIPHFSAHHIRHTFATRLCEHESNQKVIQSIMGHADIATTMNIYAEATKNRNVQTAEIINNSDSFFN